jgi:hypothetical protein
MPCSRLVKFKVACTVSIGKRRAIMKIFTMGIMLMSAGKRPRRNE